MGECKTKAIQANLGTFGYNQTHSGIIQAYLGIFRTLCYPDIIKAVVYPKPWHIQNQKHIHSPRIFTNLVYSESSFIQNPGIFRTLSHIYFEALTFFHGYDYFRKL